ncbi:hypothetical protein ciss_07430 [Carboxydothermus islandicus]|uniref:Phage tail assembly protein n=1 Tax=Carboxydothermus islandicus TaxID=661089 RepID=A0A1L8D0V9_9THEO|nr:phage tail assembly protein [Carboxydothermus islandicus]GAV24810.1 hypothetical protein ciss_07430 [Carboxydothermus islandicus]
MGKIIFSKPCVFEGKEYTEIILDFESLTGQDLINASNQARALGDNSPVLELSKTYLAVIAAKAAKVPVDMILALPAKDFTNVTLSVQNFLLEQI